MSLEIMQLGRRQAQVHLVASIVCLPELQVSTKFAGAAAWEM